MKRLFLFIPFLIIAIAPALAFWSYGSRREAWEACLAWVDKGKKELHTYSLPKDFELTDNDQAFIRKELDRLCPQKPCNSREKSISRELDCISINSCRITMEEEIILTLRNERRDERVEFKEMRNIRHCEDEVPTMKVLGIEEGNVKKRFKY
tara:strand:+ start:53 stop:508 length:456 start_codon:yes stop_codon:yes gene_type:complete